MMCKILHPSYKQQTEEVEQKLTDNLELMFKCNNMNILSGFGANAQLKSLTCIECNIMDLSTLKKQQFPVLENLVIKQNPIEILPRLNTPSIIKIDLSRNLLKNINQFLEGNYPNLVDLNLSFNYLLKSLKISFENLEILDLNDNNFMVIPPLGCPKLRVLKIMPNNGLQSMDQLYYSQELQNLEHLEIYAESGIPVHPAIAYKLSTKLKHLKFMSENIQDALTFFQFEWPKLQQISQFKIFKSPIQPIWGYDGYDEDYDPYQYDWWTDVHSPQRNFFSGKMEQIKQSQLKQLYDKFMVLPVLQMPNLQILNLDLLKQFNLNCFVSGLKQKLKKIKIKAKGWDCVILARNFPYLEQLDMQETNKVWFHWFLFDCQYEYKQEQDTQDFYKQLIENRPNLMIFPKLKSIKLPYDYGYQIIDKSQQILVLEHINTSQQTTRPILPIMHLSKSLNQTNQIKSHLNQIKIDISIVLSLEFLTFLDLTQTKKISLKLVWFEPKMIKSFAKMYLKTNRWRDFEIDIQEELVHNRNISFSTANNSSKIGFYFMPNDRCRRCFINQNNHHIKWKWMKTFQNDQDKFVQYFWQVERFEGYLQGIFVKNGLKAIQELQQ